MISVMVKAILDFKRVLNARVQEVSLPEGSNIQDLLDSLEEKFGQSLTEILYMKDKRELISELNLMINGKNILFLNGLETVLQDGDELFLLPLIGGG